MNSENPLNRANQANQEEQVESVRQVFDSWATAGRADGLERHHGPSARPAFDRLALRPDARYLDIGCGNGYTVRWAAETCPRGRAIGLDVSARMIELARRLSAAWDHVEFRQSAFPEQSLPESSFDAIFSMETFYYLPDIPAALERVHALLKPGGRFACVLDFYAENTESHDWPAELGVSMRLMSALGWKKAFGAAGLEVIEQGRIKRAPDSGAPEWKIRQGSLLTLGVKPD